MDRMKARAARSRNKSGINTRLKYRSRQGYLKSPTGSSFIIEHKLPNNYKTIKTSSRTTVATSSSLSTYDLEDEITDRPDEDFEFKHIPNSPKQAFNTHREIKEDAKISDIKASGYDIDHTVKSPNGTLDHKHVKHKPSKSRKETSETKQKQSLQEEEEDIIKQTSKHDLIENTRYVKTAVETNAAKTEVLSEETPKIETFPNNALEHKDNYKDSQKNTAKVEDISKKKQSKTEAFSKTDEENKTTKEWQPVVSKPRSTGAQAPRDKCLNECGRCGDGEKKLKLLPCLHSFCLKCLDSQVFETYRKMIRCKLCSSQTVFPSAGLDSLENNYYFHFSELSLTQNDRCDICLDKTPSTRCTECKLNICSDCIKEHLFDLERNHYVVNVAIEMIGHDPWNDPCTKHSPFNLELFCINCSQLICGRCALESHNNHVTENAELYARDKRRELENKMADHNSSRLVSNIDDHIKLLKRERERVQKDIEKTVDAIKDHVTILKNSLDEFCEQLVGDVKDKGHVYMKNYDKKIESTEHKRRATYISLETLHQIVHRTRDIEFIKKYSNLLDILTDMNLDNKLDIVPHLNINYIPVLDLGDKSVGRVNVKAQLKKPLMFTEEASIQFPRHVVTIYPVDLVRAWVGFRKHIQQCTKDGTLGLRISVGDHVVSIARSSGDTIYVACRTCVKALTSKMQLKELFPLSHEPSDMKFNELDEVIIAFRDARRLALFSNRGTVLKEFDIRHFGYRFGVRMNDPWRLAITDTHDILLTDYTSEHIAVFGEDCEMKRTFRSNVYKQASIAFDGGLIFIIDYKRDCLNVFSADGYVLQSHQLEGLKAPSCIAVASGCVWVGSWNGLVKCYHIK